MTLLPLVKVNSPGQSQPTVDLTRRVGPPTRRVPILTSQPYSLLLVEYGINSTSSLSNLKLQAICIRLAESYEQLDELFFELRRLPWTRRVVWTTRRVPPLLSLTSNSLSPLYHSLVPLGITQKGKIGDSRLDSPSRSSDSPSRLHAATQNSILLESSV